MQTDKRLKRVTGKWLKGCYRWLVKEGCGCCHIVFGESGTHEVCVCVGWTADSPKEWKVAWKIGWQTFNNAMQTDFDIDFDMPWNTKAYCDRMNAELKAKGEYSEYNRYVEGDVYDTKEIISARMVPRGFRNMYQLSAPEGYRDWNALAAFVRKTARKALAYAKEVDPGEEGE